MNRFKLFVLANVEYGKFAYRVWAFKTRVRFSEDGRWYYIEDFGVTPGFWLSVSETEGGKGRMPSSWCIRGLVKNKRGFFREMLDFSTWVLQKGHTKNICKKDKLVTDYLDVIAKLKK